MLRLPEFQYRVAKSVREAADVLAAEGARARVVAGGTDLWPNMKRRHQSAEVVVSLMDLPELRTISVAGDELSIGATAILDEVARSDALRTRYPALVRAVESISSPPLRNMGTIGGNVCVDTRCTYYNQTEEWRRSIDYCLKEAGTTCWVAPSSKRCLAHSASDSAPVLCALGAEVTLASSGDERRIPLDGLYRDDGISYLEKGPAEIVTAIHLPSSSDSDNCRASFWKLRRRGSIDFAVLSTAAAVWFEDDQETVRRASIFLGAVSSRPLFAERAAHHLAGRKLTEDVIREAAELARKPATPFDNTDFQTQWRSVMVARYTEAALREVAGLEPARQPPQHPMSV